MLNNYIVRTNELYGFYYGHGSGIVYRVYQNGRWGRERTVLADAREGYTVSLDYNGGIYLICQDGAGDIILCTQTADGFTSRPILENTSSKIYTLQLNPIFTQGGLCLVYNLPESAGNFIAMQHSADGGGWSQPERIDKFVSLNDSMFVLQQVQAEHHVLFYQTRGADTALGYREVTPAKRGAYRVFYNAGYPVADTSFLTTPDAIHVLYVVKGLFAQQLVYRRKTETEFSEPVVLCEGQQRLESCLLWYVNGRLNASFMSAGQLYVCEYGNGVFSRPERYRHKFCLSPAKAVYITAEPMSESRYYMRQVYVDSTNPCDVQLLPELTEDFYPLAETEKIEMDTNALMAELEQLRERNKEQELRIKYMSRLL